jgi:hypothetical protein
VLNEAKDVAVSRVDFPPKISIWAYPMETIRPVCLLPGHEVFFVGLFALLPGFQSVQAIVRSGRVARPSVKSQIISDPAKPPVQDVGVHLVELRSWGGESGSPVFVYEEHVSMPNADFGAYSALPLIARADLRASYVQPRLLGMLHGHFQIPGQASGGVDIQGQDVNSGIAVVLPFEDIAETLSLDELSAERSEILEERRKHATRTPVPDGGH